jgi:guanylate kinase
VQAAAGKARPDMTRAITCTTRAPRPGEKDGVDYHFLDASEFLKRLQAGNFSSTPRCMATATAF